VVRFDFDALSASERFEIMTGTVARPDLQRRPAGLDTAALAGLATVPSERVAPPRLADSPVAFECRLHQAIEPCPAHVILLARMLLVHLSNVHMGDGAMPVIDTPGLDLIGSMHGGRCYARSSELFAMDRPSWSEWGAKSGR
jgi:flavin reductase (DIM6/NTAB) family NADH-FMN oxidoreductase RutF